MESATGTYPNRNHFAGLLEMALPLALAGAGLTVGLERMSPVRGLASGWAALSFNGQEFQPLSEQDATSLELSNACSFD